MAPDEEPDGANSDETIVPESGESDEKFVPPKDGSWVPRSRLDEAVGKHASRADALAAQLAEEREARIRLEERIKAREESKPTVTRAQLQELVREGKLTEEQAEVEYEKQLAARIRSDVQREVEAKQKHSARHSTITGLIAQYKTLIPEIAVPGSVERGKVEAEYRYLVDVLGEPEGIETEAKACRSAFGPPERVKELTRERRETHREAGGGSGPKDAPKAAKKLTPRLQEHYEKMIRIGQFKGWDDPRLKAELEFVPSRTA